MIFPYLEATFFLVVVGESHVHQKMMLGRAPCVQAMMTVGWGAGGGGDLVSIPGGNEVGHLDAPD
jgi:hypothetical protein